jgi:hypothetical protein
MGASLGVSGGLVLAGVIAAFVAGRRRETSAEQEQQATFAVDDQAFTFSTGSGSRRVPRADVASASTDGARAILRLTDGTQIAARVGGEGDARALVSALGSEITGRAARFPIGRRATAVADWMSRNLGPQALVGGVAMSFFGILLSWMLAMGSGVAIWEILHLAKSGVATGIGGALAATASIMSMLAWLLLFRRREVVVGSDGVLIKGLLGRRFVPFSDIERVDDEEAGVTLALRGNDDLLLPRTAGDEGLAARLREAMQARGRADLPPERVAALNRGGRSAEERRRDLVKLAQKGNGYRDEAFSGERLAAVVEDASVPADRRVGAALMLAAAGDEPARARVRIAAAATACARRWRRPPKASWPRGRWRGPRGSSVECPTWGECSGWGGAVPSPASLNPGWARAPWFRSRIWFSLVQP